MANCFPQDLWKRQANLLPGRVFAQRYQVTPSAVDRLGLETTLRGHSGCVNCLTWSLDGQLLASGSDDLKVILWQPFHKQPKSTVINTEHRGNIFSVKFMPHTSNSTVVSGAADHMIQVHDVVQQKTVTVFPNHMKRVKRLDVAQGCPNLVWSASEDGTVMETDIRSRPGDVSVLVNLMSIMGKGAEAKCVSVNPMKPELVAVGCNDPYVRIFDRRQLKAKLIEFPADVQAKFDKKQYLSTEPDCVTGAPLSQSSRYFVPGHLQQFCRDASRDYRLRFCGHCNTTTDIKEANFFGNEGQFIVAGSDDGKFYCWDRRSTNICKVLAADESIVNCLQPHPTSCLLASSGIEPVVRLWTPSPEDGSVNDRAIFDFDSHTKSNQERMNADPFATMLRDMGIQFRPRGPGGGGSDDEEEPDQQVQCRQS